MSKVNELRDWATSAKGEGLIDVKFYPGPQREADLELAADVALTLLSGSPHEEDISDKVL